MYQIKIVTEKATIFYAGEGDGYYDGSNQYQLMGAYNAWRGALGVRTFAPSGLSVYEFHEDKEKGYPLSQRNVPEIIGGILDRQKYGFLPKGLVEIEEL